MDWIQSTEPRTDKTRKRHKLTRYGFSKTIFHKKFMLNVYCWRWSNVLYWFCAKLWSFLDNCVCSLIDEGMYVNLVVFNLALWRVEGDFVVVGIGKDFGWVWKTAFKITTCGKIGIQLPCTWWSCTWWNLL
jgi:hypothetical protein